MNIKNPHGMSFSFLENGSIKSIEVDPIRISLKAATAFSKSGANLFLRKRNSQISYKALLGSESNSRYAFKENAFFAEGNWDGIDYVCSLQLSETSLSWQWAVRITNNSGQACELDVVYLQDVGMKPATESLINEYYVSQYLERLIPEDKIYGSVVCCRQNNKESVGNPWLMIACKNGATSAATDGMQLLGRSFRETGIFEGLLAGTLGGEFSGESSMVALQEMPFKLTAGEKHRSVFAATYLPDHPQATSAEDLNLLPGLMSGFEEVISFPDKNEYHVQEKNVFGTSPFLPARDLTSEEIEEFFGIEKRHAETEDGKLLSFYNQQNNHVVLRAKELLVDRPHGHIIQAEAGYRADENIVSTTAYAYGVFNSHLTQGNTNFNIFLSICSSQFNQSPETGQRVFVEIDGQFYLLGVPSAYEIGLNHCRWIYQHDHHCFQIRTWTSKTSPRVNMDFRVLEGENVRLIVTHHFDEGNGWSVRPGIKSGEYVCKPKSGSMILDNFPESQFRMLINSSGAYTASGDEALYAGHEGHGSPFFVLNVDKTADFCVSFVGEVCQKTASEKIENTDHQFNIDCLDAQAGWNKLSLNLSLKSDQEDAAAIQEIIPWFGMNAITHFLTPHGLEQFGGAAWGTRDVAQGPLDFLLSLEKYDDAKQVLRIIFSNQNTDGGWPQWWMFDSYANIRAGDSHGDIYYWVIIGLSNYIRITGDLSILSEELPYFHEDGVAFAEKATVEDHMERLIGMITGSFIPGTSLVPFGGGDWNDSLQPVSKELAQRLISSWTVEMNYQAFQQYQVVYEMTGHFEKAGGLKTVCENIKSDFNKYLIKDEVVAGYGLVEDDGSIGVLLHPSDTKTNIQYSLLPMDRGIISGIFTKEQATHHQEIVEKYLKGPDGARLMNRPLKYRGGIQTIFQRAESSTFFGREIGLMYVHEHIRYAECQAFTGRAEAFVKALRQANPVAYRDVVACGDIRQANCYYSSSDVVFKSRYDADDRYDEISTGKITLRGGWRVYSSGPGIYITLIVTRLLGLRSEVGKITIDPVIPHSMDGLSAEINFMGHPITFKYIVREDCFNPKRISINGTTVDFTYEDNIYRKGGAVIASGRFLSLLNQQENLVEVEL
jgi:cellobiose phosphorylase